MVRSLIELMRPQQWVKNGFVLMPLFFGGRLMDPWCWGQAAITFVAFSLMASAIYCLNDIRDVEADRLHPEKCRRPLATDVLSPTYAVGLMLALAGFSLVVSCTLAAPANIEVSGVLLLYLALNVAYCFKLKQFPIIDVFCVALGFVLRLLVGGIACSVRLSPWIVLMTFLLALFLAFAKRRDDVVRYEKEGVVPRRNVTAYNLPFMNQTLGLIGAITIVCYIMYTVSPEVIARFHTEYVYITSVFVIAAILRYLQISIVEMKSGSPTKVLLHDRFIQICLLLWLMSFGVILYL